jgi:hypothetical protein
MRGRGGLWEHADIKDKMFKISVFEPFEWSDNHLRYENIIYLKNL